mgnify:CR=1 FL=1
MPPVKYLPTVMCAECDENPAMGATRHCFWCSDNPWARPKQAKVVRLWKETEEGKWRVHKVYPDRRWM